MGHHALTVRIADGQHRADFFSAARADQRLRFDTALAPQASVTLTHRLSGQHTTRSYHRLELSYDIHDTPRSSTSPSLLHKHTGRLHTLHCLS